MADLKPHYDRLVAAQAAVMSIVAMIDAAMQTGTPEGDSEALSLAPQLDGALEQRDQAQKFYDTLVKATTNTNVLAPFVPASETPNSPEPEKDQKTMPLADFQALEPRVRVKFLNAGGVVVD
jgi:hypothetical protein